MQKSSAPVSPARRPRRSRSWKPSLCLACGAVSAVASFFTGQPALAANGTDTWTTGAGDGSGDFGVAANWTTGSANKPPISGDSWTFGATTGVTSLIDNLTTGAANWNVASITFSAGAASYTINPFSSAVGFTLAGSITNSGTNLETLNDAFSITAARTLTMTTGGGNLSLGGNIAGSGGQIVTGGAGALTLSGNNSFSGISTSVNSNPAINVGVIINGQTVILGSNTAAGTGAIELSNNSAVLSAVSAGVTIGNGLVVNNTVNPTIGSGGSITVNGLLQFAGSQILSVNNTTTFAGGLDIRDSTAAARSATFAGSGAILINSTISNGITGATGSLIYQGTGSLTLSGTNTYSGGTTAAQGSLIAGATVPATGSGAFGTSTIALGSASLTGAASILTNGAFSIARAISEVATPTNASLSIGGNQTTGTSTYSGSISLTKNTTLTAASGGEVDFTTGVISGAGFNVTIDGGGLVKLTGANTFGSATASADAVTIQGGSTLNLASVANTAGASTIGNSGNGLIFNNGTLQFASAFDPSSRTLTFNSGGATFDTNGNTITFANAVGNGGAGGLTLNDSAATKGKLVLSAANTYTGGTTVTAGTLQLSGAGTLGGASGALTANGGTLDLNGTSQGVGNLTGTGGTILNNSGSGTSTLTIGNGNTGGGSYAGVIANNATGSGSVALTKTGSGSITLTGANSYTGATAVNGGTLALGGAGSLAGTAVTLAGGTLQIGSSGSTATTTIGTSGAGSVAVNSGGNLSLGNGALNALALNNSTPGATALTLNSGTLTFDIGGLSSSDSDQITLGSGLLASVSGSNVIDLNIIGSGLNGFQQQLIAWSGYAGTGTYAAVVISGTSAYTLSLTATSTGLYLNESSTSNAYWKGATNASWATLGNFTTDSAGATARTAPLDSSTNVTFIAAGGANYANTTLDGSYSINSLAFNVGGVGIANGTGSNALTLASSSGITVASGVGTTPETISANLVLGLTQGWSVADANSVLNVSGNVSGTGASLTKSGLGTLVLSGTNSYSGSTMVASGTLNVQGSGALGGTSGVSVMAGAALQLQGNVTTSAATPLTLNGTGTSTAGALENVSDANTYTGLISLGAPTTIGVDAGTLTLSNTGTITGLGDNLTLTGAGNGSLASIIGTAGGSLAKSGAGTWTLSGANTYAGGTTVSAGTLALTGAGTLGSASGLLTVNGGILDLGGTTQTVGNFTGTAGMIADNGGASTLSIGSGNASGGVFAGALTNGTGTLSINKIGTGTLAFSGTNTYTGSTTVTAGALNIQSNGGLGGSAGSGVTVATGAALQLSGSITTPSAVGLTMNGTGVTAAPNGALESVSGSNTFSGAIALGSASTIGSDIAGTLLTLNSTSPITGTGTDLTVTGAGNTTISSAVNTSGNLIKSGTGTLTLAGTNGYTGATNVNAGILVYNSLGAISSTSAINLGTASNLTYAGTGGTLGTQINFATTNGPFTLGNSGTGAIVYSAAPTFASGVKTVILGNSTDSAGGSIGGITDTPSGAVNLTKAGLTNSTWILTGGNNTHSGTTSVTGGVLSDTTPSDFANSYINLAGGNSNAAYGVLQTNGAITRTLNATASAANMNFSSNSGVAALGGNLTLTFNGGAALQWGTGNFMGAGTGALVFGSNTADSQVIFTNGFDLGQAAANLSAGYSRTVDAEGAAAAVIGGTSNDGISGSSALISGVITANQTIATSGGNGDSGNNGITKTGPGTLILSGANTYSGVTTISGGTIIAGGNSPLGAAGVFGDGHSVTPTSGGTTVAGTQAVILGNGANTNGTDSTTATGASPTVLIGGAYTVAVPVDIGGASNTGVPSGTVTTSGTYGIGGSTANSATFSGLITAGQNFTVTQAAGGTLNITDGIVGVGANVKTITFNNAGAVNVSSAAIADGANGGSIALAKSGGGTLTLAAANTYTGATSLAAGTLLVTGSTSATSMVSTLAGTTLGGNGTIGGAASVAGTLSPGAVATVGSVGNLNVGALTLASTTNVLVDVNGASTSTFDTVTVAGKVTYNGTLTVDLGTYAPTASTIVQLFAFGSESGNFTNDSAVTFDQPGFVGTFNESNGMLTIAPVPEAATWMSAGLFAGVCGFYLRRRFARGN